MKILHSARITPQLCGLYETTRELVAAEVALGHDAALVDPLDGKKSGEDRGAPIKDMSFKADVIVNHSGVNDAMKATGLPIVHVMHGRPRSSFLLEKTKKTKILSYLLAVRHDPQFKAFVTLWPKHKPFWDRFLAPHEVKVIPAPVDLVRWTPDGPKGYGFHGHKGAVNLVCADAWREDTDPFNVLCAAAVYASETVGVKVHLYGVDLAEQDGVGALTQILKDLDALGEVIGRVKGLANVYRAADVALCPHQIATRSMREPMACGCPVVSANDADPEYLGAFAHAIRLAVQGGKDLRPLARARAERDFDPANSAKALLGVIEEALK